MPDRFVGGELTFPVAETVELPVVVMADPIVIELGKEPCVICSTEFTKVYHWGSCPHWNPQSTTGHKCPECGHEF